MHTDAHVRVFVYIYNLRNLIPGLDVCVCAVDRQRGTCLHFTGGKPISISTAHMGVKSEEPASVGLIFSSLRKPRVSDSQALNKGGKGDFHRRGIFLWVIREATAITLICIAVVETFHQI